MVTHLRRIAKMNKEVSVAWLCDVDPRQTDKLSQLMAGFQSASPKRTSRHEEVIADPGVDAIITDLPRHIGEVVRRC